MQEIKIASLCEFLKTIEGRSRNNRWLFRGQSKLCYPLRPKIGRKIYFRENETKMFKAWKRAAYEHVGGGTNLTDWDWLTIAQHHGLATRLLDWAKNPLAAAYFAVRSHPENDAAIFALQLDKEDEIDLRNDPDPFAFRRTAALFLPRRVTPRVGHQLGVFTVHGDPRLDLTAALKPSWNFIKLVIESKFKHDFRLDLSDLAIDQYSLFPDLDGLSAHINWITQMEDDLISRAKPKVCLTP